MYIIWIFALFLFWIRKFLNSYLHNLEDLWIYFIKHWVIFKLPKYLSSVTANQKHMNSLGEYLEIQKANYYNF